MIPQTNDVRERLQETAAMLGQYLPPGTGFVLLAFDTGTDLGRLEYVANCQREDVVRAMQEFIAKTVAGWGSHLPEHGRPLLDLLSAYVSAILAWSNARVHQRSAEFVSAADGKAEAAYRALHAGLVQAQTKLEGHHA